MRWGRAFLKFLISVYFALGLLLIVIPFYASDVIAMLTWIPGCHIILDSFKTYIELD